MRKIVAASWFDFATHFEGYCDFMYLDVKSLVTCAVGNLIDPMSAALTLLFKRSDGTPATQKEIADEWLRVKHDAALNPLNGGGQYRKITKLRLSPDDIRTLVRKRAIEMWGDLRTRFGSAENWPANAQMGTLSMAWALGQHFHRTYPKFAAAADAGDFAMMAWECTYRADNESAKQRVATNQRLFMAAARDVSESRDYDAIADWKASLNDDPPHRPAAPTVPDLTTGDIAAANHKSIQAIVDEHEPPEFEDE